MKGLRAAWIVFFTGLIASLYVLTDIPADTIVATHYNMDGVADRTNTILTALAFVNGMSLFILVVMTALTWLEPRKENLQKSSRARQAITLAVVCLMIVIGITFVAEAYEYPMPRQRIIFVSIFVLFIFIGNFLPKLRSNFFMGVRTPWTLSSDTVWTKTHRLAGPIFMLAGLIGIPFALLAPVHQMTFVILGLILPASLIPVAYSWWLWRQEQSENTGDTAESR